MKEVPQSTIYSHLEVYIFVLCMGLVNSQLLLNILIFSEAINNIRWTLIV